MSKVYLQSQESYQDLIVNLTIHPSFIVEFHTVENQQKQNGITTTTTFGKAE
jgi:hypothetical protein